MKTPVRPPSDPRFPAASALYSVPSIADVAHVVDGIIDDHDCRFVAVVVRPESPGSPAYGFSNRGSYQAIVSAVGEQDANNVVADARQGDSYLFDQNFGRDVSRLTDSDGELLAILIRA